MFLNYCTKEEMACSVCAHSICFVLQSGKEQSEEVKDVTKVKVDFSKMSKKEELEVYTVSSSSLNST